MIKFENVSFGFPDKDLYNDISFEIEDGDHAVLIGSNGTGKSTLIDLLLHEERYTYDGKITLSDTGRIGYVPQFVKHEKEDTTVFDFLKKPFTEIQKKQDELCLLMAKGENLDKLYEEYQKSLDEMDSVDGYNADTNILKMLSLSGIEKIKDLELSKISGGEFKLVSIIGNMLLKPHLLIMDEPDVFLDFENIIGLTKLINEYKGTVLTVTHSRLLLSQCFNRILHIENTKLQEFPGTFAEYNDFLLDTKVEMYASAVSFDEFIEIQETLIEKIRKKTELNPDPKKGRQLKARVTYLRKLKDMRGEDPFLDNGNYRFSFTPYEPDRDDVIIDVKDYALSYDGLILSDVGFTVKEGEHVALVGSNGTGKSSLLRDIYDMYVKQHGEESIGYFRQIYESDTSENMSGGELNIKRLKELSGRDLKVLLLDEPTSHLGTYAQLALEKALREYKGTVIFVSHDFFTITGIADRILLLEDSTLRETSARQYRKSIYRKYFESDIFEAERKRTEREIRVINLLKHGKYVEAKEELKKQ
ncbi:MAG: ATP-binding cassette domain-containing protein [Clostridia bacterium]|nr:ATP-binding cassette domain-containing protein [Clostridia bacterium]